MPHAAPDRARGAIQSGRTQHYGSAFQRTWKLFWLAIAGVMPDLLM
jgi:hypothetical protein